MVLKCLLLGHSFVNNFKKFIRSNPSEFNFTLNLDPKEVMIQFSGSPGANVESLKSSQLSIVEDFEPELVILDIGTNDLCFTNADPIKLASTIDNLVDTLIRDYHVQHVVVIQILHRFHPSRPTRRHIDIKKFNKDVDTCNELLAEKLSGKENCKLWWHKGFWGANRRRMIDSDGVHFSKPIGQRKYYYNLRAILVSYIKSTPLGIPAENGLS